MRRGHVPTTATDDDAGLPEALSAAGSRDESTPHPAVSLTDAPEPPAADDPADTTTAVKSAPPDEGGGSTPDSTSAEGPEGGATAAAGPSVPVARGERPTGAGLAARRAPRRGVFTPFLWLFRLIRKATHAEGAGETGLAKLIELSAVNSFTDTLVTLALANTLFFSVSNAQARSQVALYLLLTVAPFAVVAPVLGPLLDRLRNGRRFAIAATLLAKGILAVMMAHAVNSGSLLLYPGAFGVLVASKAFGISRSAVIPRVLPRAVTLVRANSRISMAQLVALTLAAPVGAGLGKIGSQWTLWTTAAVCAGGVVMAVRLPRRVDSSAGEQSASLLPEVVDTAALGVVGLSRRRRRGAEADDNARLRRVGPVVLTALRANMGLRIYSGFLTIFMAFLLRQHPIGGLKPTVALGLIASAAGVGNAIGTAIGSVLKGRAPEPIIAVVLTIATAACTGTVFFYGTESVVGVAAAAGFCQALGKLSLDALIQREIPEQVRTSAFGRSETLIQLAWVIGGVLGIALPLNGKLGLGVVAAILALVLAWTGKGLLRPKRRTRLRARRTAR